MKFQEKYTSYWNSMGRIHSRANQECWNSTKPKFKKKIEIDKPRLVSGHKWLG